MRKEAPQVYRKEVRPLTRTARTLAATMQRHANQLADLLAMMTREAIQQGAPDAWPLTLAADISETLRTEANMMTEEVEVHP